MSELMRAFLRAYLEWATSGAENYKPFSRRLGLCACIGEFEAAYPHEDALYGELLSMFEADGLDGGFPFGDAAYFTARESGTQHLDENRLNWIRSKLEAP